MAQVRLDGKLLAKIAKRRGKNEKYIREQVSRLANRRAISSEAALILFANEDKIGTAAFLRRQIPHIQEQVRSVLNVNSASVTVSKPEEVFRERIKKYKFRKDISKSTLSRIADALTKKFHIELGNAYQQVLLDLKDTQRLSLRGTANEMREILRDVISKLSPEDQVVKQDWYRQEPKVTGPTRAQRLKYIFQKKGLGSGSVATEAGANLVEESVSRLTLAVYQNLNNATHTQKQREELNRILSYMNPVILDLLKASDL